MIEIGKWNRLRILKERSVGFFFDGGDAGDILMPKRHQPEQCAVGDEMDVFVFHDAEGRLTATIRKPYVQVGEIALLKVLALHPSGAFLDWGMTKDLFVPARDQLEPMQVGKSYLVHVHLDAFDKIVGSSKLEDHLHDRADHFEARQSVQVVIAEQTPLGYKAIVERAYWGLIYANEVFEPLEIGQNMTAYVKKCREDGKLDLALHPLGYNLDRMDDLSQRILQRIEAEGGFLPVTDKSPPEAIYKLFQMSKKNFKQAVGKLYKARLIVIEERGLRKTAKA